MKKLLLLLAAMGCLALGMLKVGMMAFLSFTATDGLQTLQMLKQSLYSLILFYFAFLFLRRLKELDASKAKSQENKK